MSICDAQGNQLLVQYSTNATTWDDVGVGVVWTNVSADSGMLDVSGGDKSAAEFKTFDGAVVAIDRSGVININLNVVFRNSVSSFLEFLTDTWDGTETECFFLRWAYANGAAGALRRTAEVSLLTNPFTGADASSATPISKSLTFATAEVHRDVVPA